MNTGTTPRPLTHEELNDTLAAVRIPPCPAIVTEVMREAQRDEPSIKVLTRILASDVGMSAMAIKLANSPMFGSGGNVKSIQQAVTRLGISNILSVVIAVALRSTNSGLPAELMDSFWSRAATLALSAGVLARKHVGISPESAYTYALFHDAASPGRARLCVRCRQGYRPRRSRGVAETRWAPWSRSSPFRRLS